MRGVSFIFFILFIPIQIIHSQRVISDYFIDSLTIRANELELRSSQLKKQRSPEFFRTNTELSCTNFKIEYYKLVQKEELDAAKDIISKELLNAKNRKDEFLTDFYTSYNDTVNREIKLQAIKYQNLIGKEKYFKKTITPLLKENSVQSLTIAKHKTNLALKYAISKNIESTQNYLNAYLRLINAMEYDLNSQFDLAELSVKQKKFEKTFKPLLESDSISDILKAGALARESIEYQNIIQNTEIYEYLQRQVFYVDNALSQYYMRQGMKNEGVMTGNITKLKVDSLNPEGVYKWGEFIIVIKSFHPQSRYDNVKKGEAMIHSDKYLVNYLKANDLGNLDQNDKVTKNCLVPYKQYGKFQELYFNEFTAEYQFRVCYKEIKDKKYTETISKYLPPISFENQ